MDLAKVHLTAVGWPSVKDVSAKESFDLHCMSDDDELFVEVKGTTSSGESIILTKNEVFLHQERWPKNALIVVTRISLQKKGDKATASGGSLEMIAPWKIEDEHLSPISYLYLLASE
jgi:hypothetical protein